MSIHTELDNDTRQYHYRSRFSGTIGASWTHPLAIAIKRLDGVESARVYNYLVEINKSPVFSWDEIEPFVMELICADNPKAFGEPKMEPHETAKS